MKLLLAVVLLDVALAYEYTEEEARLYIANVSFTAQQLASKRVLEEWNYKTSLTETAAEELEEARQNYYDYIEEIWPELNKFTWKQFEDSLLKRQFYFMSQREVAALPKEKRTKLWNTINSMIILYNTIKIKEFNSSSDEATLDGGDVSGKFPADYLHACEMSFYWEGWHNELGRSVKEYFIEYVKLVTELAQLNGFTDYGALWRAKYEMGDVKEVVESLMKQIDPLFKQLHAYVRRQLYLLHGEDVIDLQGPIPVHLLGTISGMDGVSILKSLKPYPEVPDADVDQQLVTQNYTGYKMAKVAEEWFTSIGLLPMPSEYYNQSIFEVEQEQTIDCATHSFNFYDGCDYRTISCVGLTLEDFGGLAHEEANIENFLYWSHLPFGFQKSPNEGFFETCGEMVNQYVTSLPYLKKLDLLPDGFPVEDERQRINYLMRMALYDIIFLPYALSLEVWRWKVFSGEITPEHYNCQYWKIRAELQGVTPPVDRYQVDFDVADKHNVVNDEQYIKFFLNIIFQYQWHLALCIEAGEFDPKDPHRKPLHLCDISNNTLVGNKLKRMISVGAQKPWPDSLEILTGQREVDASPLLQFFQPLHDWLVEENNKNGDKVGWNQGTTDFCAKEVVEHGSSNPCQYV